MTWTYAAPTTASGSTASKNKVRFLIGDTSTADKQILDEEIVWLINENGSSVYLAASEACKALAAEYARRVDKNVGDLKVSASQRQGHYLALSKELRRRAGRNVSPYAGGISIDDKDSVVANTDRVKPAFERNQFDNPMVTDPRASTGI